MLPWTRQPPDHAEYQPHTWHSGVLVCRSVSLRECFTGRVHAGALADDAATTPALTRVAPCPSAPRFSTPASGRGRKGHQNAPGQPGVRRERISMFWDGTRWINETKPTTHAGSRTDRRRPGTVKALAALFAMLVALGIPVVSASAATPIGRLIDQWNNGAVVKTYSEFELVRLVHGLVAPPLSPRLPRRLGPLGSGPWGLRHLPLQGICRGLGRSGRSGPRPGRRLRRRGPQEDRRPARDVVPGPEHPVSADVPRGGQPHPEDRRPRERPSTQGSPSTASSSAAR